MQKLEYNGWTNYETWNFKLWADNNERTYKKVQKLVKDIKQNCFDESLEPLNLADELRTLAEDEAPELKTSFYSDVINASIKEVNYLEIAKSYLEPYTPAPVGGGEQIPTNYPAPR